MKIFQVQRFPMLHKGSPYSQGHVKPTVFDIALSFQGEEETDVSSMCSSRHDIQKMNIDATKFNPLPSRFFAIQYLK